MCTSRRSLMLIFSTLTIFAGQGHHYPLYRDTKSSKLRRQHPRNIRNNYFNAQTAELKTSVDRITHTLKNLNASNKNQSAISEEDSSAYFASGRSSLKSIPTTPHAVRKTKQTSKYPIVNEEILSSSFNLNLNKKYREAHPLQTANFTSRLNFLVKTNISHTISTVISLALTSLLDNS